MGGVVIYGVFGFLRAVWLLILGTCWVVACSLRHWLGGDGLVLLSLWVGWFWWLLCVWGALVSCWVFWFLVGLV